MKGLLFLIAMLFVMTSTAIAGQRTDPPYEPTRGYIEKMYLHNDVPDSVYLACESLVHAEYEPGAYAQDVLFLGEIPGGAVYGYTNAQYQAAKEFIVETDFTRQGVMAIGTSSSHRYDPKQGNRVMTFFYNVLLGPGRSGAIGGQLDYRLRACVTPITGWRQGVILVRVGRALIPKPDMRPIRARFSTADHGLSVRPFVGATIQRSGDFSFGTPVIGVVAFKVFHSIGYQFEFDPAEHQIDIMSGEELRRVAIGVYAFMGESMQPMSHGVYAAGVQIGDHGVFGRFGYVNMNRFDRGTDVPDRLARGPSASLGYSALLSPNMTLDATVNFGPTFTSSTSNPRGTWFGNPGLTIVVGRNF